MRNTLLNLPACSGLGRRLGLAVLASGLLVGLCPLHAAAQTAPAASGAYLLRKAEALQAASQYDAAEAAFNQATAAYRRAADTAGQQRALTELATMEEKRADELLAGIAAPQRAAAPAPTANNAPLRNVAAAPRPAAALPAQRLAAPPAAAGPAPLPGSMAGGKPVGLFFFMSSFNEERTYYFTPAGQVYVDPANFSAAGLAAVAPNWRGTFAINGKQMTIKWANGQTQTASNYHFDPTGFGWEGSFLCLAPFASTRQLLGTFEGHNDAVSVDANSLTAYRTLSFKPDGTFTRDNLASAHLETNTGLTTDATSAAKQAGRWQLSGWYLTLTDARGTMRGVAYPTGTDDKTGKALYFRFNGTTYRNSNQ